MIARDGPRDLKENEVQDKKESMVSLRGIFAEVNLHLSTGILYGIVYMNDKLKLEKEKKETLPMDPKENGHIIVCTIDTINYNSILEGCQFLITSFLHGGGEGDSSPSIFSFALL